MKNKKELLKKDFLLEIGCEELPSGYIEPVISHLRLSTQMLLGNSRITFDEIKVYGTPNRLVIYAAGLRSRQEPQRERINGPSEEAAFDKEGKPTQACVGFLKSKGADLKDIFIESTQKGKYVFIEREKESFPAKKILLEILPALITSIRFPKAMRWNSSAVRFARPIRWLAALYGTETISFKLGGLTASNKTRLPRYLSPAMEPVMIKSVSDYFEILKKCAVIVDQNVRERRITAILKNAAKKLNAAEDFNTTLIKTVTYLSESPVGFTGKLNREYLRLPVEVLESSMAKNQRIFLLKDRKKEALPYFVGIINGRRKNIKPISRTFEAILNAKLKDSKFFLEEDLKIKHEDRIEMLKSVVFQAKLGSMYERVMRIKRMSLYILDTLNLFGVINPADQIDIGNRVERAALLSKTDLVTQMVKEFPDLQGIIGREYARMSGEKEEIYNAISEHYLPKGPSDPLPSGYISNIVAIADKADMVTGFFAIGLIPSGSEDPYGIRRASLGLLKILLENRYPLSLDILIDKTLEIYGNTIGLDKGAVKSRLILFMKERLKNILLDKNFKDDIIDAVLSSASLGRFDELNKKLIDLSSISQAKYLLESAKVIERISNILKTDKKLEEDIKEVNRALLKEQLEKDLWDSYEKNGEKIREKIAKGEYAEATRIYAAAFFNPTHLFFEKVVVNVQDQPLRANRFALLKTVHNMYVDNIADISKIKFQ